MSTTSPNRDVTGIPDGETPVKIIAQLEAKGDITPADVLALRRAIYGQGAEQLGSAEVDAIFRVDHAVREKIVEWRDFYVEVLTDYFVWKSDPPKYISGEQGEFLIRNLLRDNRIAGVTELELLINLVRWADDTPALLKVLVLESVRDSVLTPDEDLYGWGREPGVITPADVEIVRRAIYSMGTLGGYTVTQHEAELLFELEDATDGAPNAEGWQDLFVKGIANFLMFPRGPAKVLSAAEYKRRELWLESRRGVGNLLMDVAKSATDPHGWLERFREGWERSDTFGIQARRAQAEKEAAEVREALSRESIDAVEARWLVARIDANGKVTENERKLLGHIRKYSPSIDPHLDEMMKRFGI